MALIELRDVSFTYPQSAEPALRGVSFAVARGEFVVLCGASGSGKSTLLRLLKREVSPGGRAEGEILFGGKPVQNWPAGEIAGHVGLVMQHPENQLVVDTVEHELAFGMENFALDADAMRRRMAEMAGFFGLESLLDRRTDELSGGQKQTVNLAAVLMLQPRVLLLDEPLAQLDPLAARELLGMIKRLNEEWGITVIMSEHRIDELLPQADRVVRLESGAIAFDGSARDFVREAWRRGTEPWLDALPGITRWALRQRPPHPEDRTVPPLTHKEARLWAAADAASEADASDNRAAGSHDSAYRGSAVAKLSGDGVDRADRAERERFVHRSASGARPLLRANGLFFAYDKASPAVLRGLDWHIRRGDWAALFGGNGSGKSTLLQLLAGLRAPQRGTVFWDDAPIGRIPAKEKYSAIGYLAQNPLLHFVKERLLDDLALAASRAGREEPERAAREMAGRFGLAGLLARHPMDLSGGERQLGALAIILLGRPKLLLLDEPTKGLDPSAKRRLGEHLRHIHAAGVTMAMATHDVEFAAGCANRCALLFRGGIAADEAPDRFFRDNIFYTTPIFRLLTERGEAMAP